MINAASPIYCQPKITNEKKGKRQVSINQDPNYKSSATVILTCSNNGRKKDAHIIFRKVPTKKDKDNSLGTKIESTLNFPDNVKVHATPSGWMNRYVLAKWHNLEFDDNKDRRLLLDRAGSHYTEHFVSSLTESQKANTIYIPSGCTDELQPLDISVNKLFKDYYRQYMDSNPMPSLKSKAQSERQHVIDAVSHAWEKIPSHVIISEFVKSGISRRH